jgi:hypothetical protein
MSYQASAYVKGLRLAPNGESITTKEKLVLFHLADAHNAKQGTAWPSQPTIAEDCMICVRHVQNLLYSLERKGVIRTIRPERNGRGRFVRYSFPQFDAQWEKGTEHAPVVSDFRKTQERRGEHHGNTQKTRTIDALTPLAIKEEHRTENTRTEQQLDRPQIPEGLDQDRGKYVWFAIQEFLKARIAEHTFEIWLKPLKSAGCADGELWIRLPRPEFKEMVERYCDLIKEALTSNKIDDIKNVRFA